MTSAGDKNRIAEALEYLRVDGQFFEFDDQERVVKVSISGTASADEAAAHVGNLRDLQDLSFYTTGLTDHGLSHLAGALGLRKLWIDGSGVTSSGLTHLGAMSQLEELYIGNARDFDRAAFDCISRVSNLRQLTLRDGSFCDADLVPLAALVKLEKLSLTDNNRIHGTFCDHLMGLSRLKYLNPGEQVTDEGLGMIARLSGLVDLYAGGPFTNAGLTHLTSLQRLESLAIHSELVTSEGIAVVATFPRLQCLYLSTPRLGDDGIAALLGCAALEEMVITRSAVSDGGLQQLRDRLPKCNVYDIERDQWQPEPEGVQVADRLELDSSTPFEVLLAKARDFDLVNGTFVKIGARYNHWIDASQYTHEEGIISLVWHSHGLIGNGGLQYLFAGEFPGDPDFQITAEAYRIAGIERSYQAFQAAFRLFPGNVAPRDPVERSRLYEAANKSARAAIDRKFWQDEPVITKRLAEFIRTHASRLGDLDAP
jgi:Domain of unknown function (DUF4375)